MPLGNSDRIRIPRHNIRNPFYQSSDANSDPSSRNDAVRSSPCTTLHRIRRHSRIESGERPWTTRPQSCWPGRRVTGGTGGHHNAVAAASRVEKRALGHRRQPFSAAPPNVNGPGLDQTCPRASTAPISAINGLSTAGNICSIAKCGGTRVHDQCPGPVHAGDCAYYRASPIIWSGPINLWHLGRGHDERYTAGAMLPRDRSGSYCTGGDMALWWIIPELSSLSRYEYEDQIARQR